MSTTDRLRRCLISGRPAEFVDIISHDPVLLHREFDDIIAAEWPDPLVPAPPAQTTTTGSPRRQPPPEHAGDRPGLPRSRPRRPGGRQRSPPRAADARRPGQAR